MVTFNNTDCFIGINNQAVKQNTTVSHKLPQQYTTGILKLPSYFYYIVSIATYIAVSAYILNILL